MREFTFGSAAALILLFVAGCSSEADKAAKARIFSPEDPSPDLMRAAERLDISTLASDPRLWARIMEMDRLEATRRLGAHEATSKVKFTWKRGSKTVSLVEDATFQTDAEGNFRMTLVNDEDSGMEFVWAEGRAFARSRYGQFRERRIDRAQHNVWRNNATGALSTAYGLYDGRLRPAESGTGTHEGRSAQRFAFLVSEERWGEPPVLPARPPRVEPKVRSKSGELVPGPDEATGRRLAFDALRQPRSARGEVLVDAQTGVVLKAKLEGTFAMAPESPEDKEALLTLSVDFSLSPKKEVKIPVPDKLVSAAIPHALKDPLAFLGEDAPKKAAAEPADED